MNPAPPTAPRPALADLFDDLRREGFRLRPDDYVEVQQVLQLFQPQTPDDVRALVAPLLVTSAAEQEKFDRIFAAAFREVELPKPPPPKPPKPIAWGWWVAAGVALLFGLYAAFLWPMPEVASTSVTHRFAGPYLVGDTLHFEVDSALRNAAGPQVHWAWETPDGLPHANEPIVAVKARRVGDLAVKLTATRHEGLLVPGAFVTTTSTVGYPVCPTLPELQLDSLPGRAGSDAHRYAARVTNGRSVQAVVWEVNGTAVARGWTFEYRPPRQPEGSSYLLTARAYPDTTQSLCYGEATLSRYVSGTGETPFTVDVRSAGQRLVPETRVKAPFVWALRLLVGALVLVLGLYVWRVIRNALREPPSPPAPPDDGQNPLTRFVSDEPPLELPFENREASLVTRDEAFHQVVRTLRQRTEEETARLHVGNTLRATVREGGFPTLVYQPRLAETEYLFLIDRSQVRSQQVALFEYLFRAFCRENVGIERFFFHQKFDRFTNEARPAGLSLRQLTDAYRSRALVVWGDGRPLLYPAYPVVDPAHREALGEFAHRAVLTPVPFEDWGQPERALQEVFLLLPADLPGQVRLMQALAEGKTHQDAYLRQQAREFYSTEYVDFGDVDGLRAYLADEGLVQWLGAVALYPRLRWEVVVEMGRAVLPPERVNFTNLLKLVRIGWMHEGSLPDRLRLDLLKILTPENEVKARETLLRMLEHAEKFFPGERFFGEEKYLLQTTNRFTLYAHDAERFADFEPALKEFRTLRDKKLLPDRTMVRYLENEGRQWETPVASRRRSPDADPDLSLEVRRLTREVGELDREEENYRRQAEEAFQQGNEELASRLEVSLKAVHEQWETAMREWNAAQSELQRQRTAGTALADYFAALPPDETAPPPPPAPTPRDPLRLPLLATILGLGVVLVGVWLFSRTARAREVDPDQQIPLTVLLDSNACVTPGNTNPAGYPRWTVSLGDSLVNLTNLRGTRTFTLAALQNSGSGGSDYGDETALSQVRDWFSTAFRPADDSLRLYVTLAVRDTGSAPAQSRFVALAGDTLRVAIACRDQETPYQSIVAVDSTQPPTTTRLRVDVFYSEENQTATQRLAQKLAQGLRASGLYDVQVKLLRTTTNRQRYYLVSRNEVRFDAEERPQALQVKATAEALLRAENITFAPYGVARPDPSKNYVSLFIVNAPAAGNAFVCQPVDPDWLSRFDGWEGTYSDANYSTPVLNFSPTRSGQYRMGIAQQVTVSGRTNTVQNTDLGTSARICQQNGIYLVQTSTTGSGRAMLIRAVTNRSCQVAQVTLDAAALNGPQGQAYLDKLIRGASFSSYSVPTKPVSTANEAAQTAAPDDVQSSVPAQNQAPITWQRLGRVQLSNQAQDDWSSLNELARTNPNGRLRVVIHCGANEFPGYRDRIAKVLPAASGRIAFENQPLDTKAQAYPTPYAEVFGSGITPPASAR